MANVVVVGSQWGDEGKGKIVDWLSERADIVVRFQGGHNAGHTLVVDGTTYKLSLLPSGVVRKGKLSVIGNGVVVDPWALADEIAKIEPLGVDDQPRQSPHRRERDADPAAAPRARLRCARPPPATGRIGTTGRGIGPAYEDKVGRRAIRVMDLQDLPTLKPKIERILAHHNALRRGLGQPEISRRRSVRAARRDRAEDSALTSTRCGRCSTRSGAQGKRILFEGAQGALLDIDHGTYPFVTSSNTVAAQAATGSGVGPGRDRLRARHHQGLHHAGGRGAVPDRAQGRDRQAARRARRRVRHGDRAAAPLRLVRRRAWCARRARSAASTASR